MTAKTVGTGVLLAFVAASIVYLVVSEARTPAEPVPTSAPTTAAAPAHQVIAYYFHNTQRCPTCRKIEALAEETLRERFPDALKAGTLEWRTVNMEEPGNIHFMQDYGLVASSVVIVDLRDGQQCGWTNLEKVWEYVHDDEATFKQYVGDHVRDYLES